MKKIILIMLMMLVASVGYSKKITKDEFRNELEMVSKGQTCYNKNSRFRLLYIIITSTDKDEIYDTYNRMFVRHGKILKDSGIFDISMSTQTPYFYDNLDIVRHRLRNYILNHSITECLDYEDYSLYSSIDDADEIIREYFLSLFKYQL